MRLLIPSQSCSEQTSNTFRFATWCVAFVPLMLLCGCGQNQDDNSPAIEHPGQSAQTHGTDAGVSETTVTAIKAFCGNCHAMPLAESFPKSMWYEEVRRGFNFYYESGRTDLTPPSQADVVAYFRDRAPEELPSSDQKDVAESPVRFTPTAFKLRSDSPISVSFIDRHKDESGADELWLSDMKSGGLIQIPRISSHASQVPSEVETGAIRFDASVSAHPAACRRIDLDSNGTVDFLVTDLGSFLPEDHSKGAIVWIPDAISPEPKPPVVLWKGIGRIADVQPVDIDADGRIDLAVAEFGWHQTGSVTLLKNRSNANETHRFEPHRLDDRPGAIHVIPIDIDGDQRMDIVSLISQEHEQIVAYLNKESGFEKKSLYAAPDPSWGSSGIQLIDLDQDGDLDFVYTNGDSFDSKLVKPYHGVWWLENVGDLSFKPQHVAAMPGVHRALAADFDGDGDLDIAAAAMLPITTLETLNAGEMHALVWLEQLADHKFARHVVERGAPRYAAMTVGDFNGDNRPDIATGVFEFATHDVASVARVFWNQQSSNR